MFLSIVRRASSLFSLLLPLALLGAVAWSLNSKWDEITAFARATYEEWSGSAPVKAPATKIETEPRPDETTTATETEAALPHSAVPNDTIIQAGDTLQLTFYERLISEDDKWMARSHSRRPPKTFQKRAELSGTYDLRENGTIVVPLLGAFEVQGRTIADFEADAKGVFENLIGRLAFVSVAIRRKPIYVVGPVNKPGSYKFTDGMTVLHAVALAGGFDHAVIDLNHMLRAVEEVEGKEKSSETLKRLLARRAVLEAERDATAPVPPTELLTLAGLQDGQRMIDAEKSVRDLAAATRRAESEALAAALKAAQEELASKLKRLEQVQANVNFRSERVDTLRGMKETVSRVVRAQAEAELSDVKERVQEAEVGVREAETKVHDLEKESITSNNKARMDLERDLMTVKTEVEDALRSGSGSAGALNAIRKVLQSAEDGSGGATEFEIVRGPTGNKSILRVSPTASLVPGDLVRITTRTTIDLSSGNHSGRQP